MTLTENWSELAQQCLEHAEEMIFWVRKDGSFLYVNPAVVRTLGYTREEFYGLRVVNVVSGMTEEERDQLRAGMRRAGRYSLRIKLRCKDGTEVPVESINNIIEIGGQEIKCAFSRNITDQINYERYLVAEQGRLERENQAIRNALADGESQPIIGNSPVLRKVLRQAARVASGASAVLINGESGVGKELIARFVHHKSARAEQPILSVNCAALPASTIASELFGHVKGAFTGADRNRKGIFEQAAGGSLFLDEVGDLPADVQAMLLRVLQEGVFNPVGGERAVHSDVRIIAATNRDLEEMVKEGTFRNDLYYRLNVFPLLVPPLRDRPEDIGPLVHYFLRQLNLRTGEQRAMPSPEEMERFSRYSFPGNVRELSNLVERAFYLTEGERLFFPGHGVTDPGNATNPDSGLVSFATAQREYLLRVLRHCRGKISGPGGAAAILELNPNTLTSKLRKLNIQKEDWVKG